MRLLVVGAGSVGGYFGGRLVQAGRDVTFLVRPQRARQLAERGLEILSPHGDVTLNPTLVMADAITAPFDAILLTTKGYALEGAMDDFARAVGPATMILPVLNGMRHVDILKKRFGEAAVAGCTCKCATVLDDTGRIVQIADLQDLSYGEMDGRPSSRMAALDASFAGVGFNARLSPTIAREMWEKWLLLASLGAITCLMRGTIGDIAASPYGPELAHGIIDEAVAIISAVGLAPGQQAVEAAHAQLTQSGSPLTSSMFRDLELGRRIEADEIVGDLVGQARRAGMAAPLLSAAYTHLSIYARRQSA